MLTQTGNGSSVHYNKQTSKRTIKGSEQMVKHDQVKAKARAREQEREAKKVVRNG